MVIAIDASRLEPSEPTGVEYYSYWLLRELKKIIPSADRVVLYSREPIEPIIDGLPPNWKNKVLSWPLKYLWSQLRLAWQLRVDQPDLLFVPAHVLPFGYSGRMVVTIHDLTWFIDPGSYNWRSRWYLKLANAVAVRRAAAIITISEFSRRELLAHYPAVANKIFVTPLAATMRRELATPPAVTGPYLVILGRVERKKNILVVLAALARLYAAEASFNHKLLLIGKPGVGAEEIMARLGQPDLQGKVVWLGWQPADQVANYLTSATALLFPGKGEGFGLPVLDAWSAQVPVVAAHSGALPEVVAEAGLLVPPDEVEAWQQAIKELVDNLKLRERLTSLGSERLKQFSWRATAEATWQVLKLALPALSPEAPPQPSSYPSDGDD